MPTMVLVSELLSLTFCVLGLCPASEKEIFLETLVSSPFCTIGAIAAMPIGSIDSFLIDSTNGSSSPGS